MTCEKRFWRGVLETITNCPHEAFMSFLKAHLSENVVSINLCCVTKTEKDEQVLDGKKKGLLKSKSGRKHLGHATWKKKIRQSLVKEDETAGEAIFEPSKLTEKKIKCTYSLAFSTIRHVVSFQLQAKHIVQNVPSAESTEGRNRLWNPSRTGSCWWQ